MANFDDFRREFQSALASFAATSFSSAKAAAIQDGQAFVTQATGNLQRWTGLLASKSISQEDFDSLVAGQKDLIETQALEAAGLAQAALDRFTNGLINLVVSTAIKVFLA